MADFRYYMRIREEKEFSVDHVALKPYFPVEKVIEGALGIYQTILGLKFTEIDGEAFHKLAPEIQLFAVTDKKTGDLQGHFYLDLYPREGKYGHAACFTLQSGCDVFEDGKVVGRQQPACAMVCNFPKPTEDAPGLLMHNDVVTFFHEF